MNDGLSYLPREPADRLTEPLMRFLHIEAMGGIVLLFSTLVALAIANTTWSEPFLRFWEIDVSGRIGNFEISRSLKHWINDGLMTLFFFVISLELKREFVLGEFAIRAQ